MTRGWTSLTGAIAVVSGASSGLGRHFVEVLHEAGAHVVAVARRTERLSEIAERLGPRIEPHTVDVTDEAFCSAMIRDLIDAHGRIDVLVNSAGTSHPGPAEEVSPADFARVLDVNLTGAYRLCHHAGRHMCERGSGTIVNVASILGTVATAPMSDAAYAASKAGLIHLTRDLAAQWARRGVRVNGLAPGWFPTEMNRELFASQRLANWVDRRTPLGRPGREGELDDALLFLASDASSYITGHTMIIDGGWALP